VNVPVTKFYSPPDGATYLLLVTDPENKLGNFDPTKNVKSLELLPVAPSISLFVRPVSAQMGEEYNLWAEVTNNAPLTLPIDINWHESWPAGDAAQLPRESDFPAHGKVSVTLRPGAGTDVFLQSFTRSWDWIPPTNPTKTFAEFLADLDSSLATSTLDTIVKFLGTGLDAVMKGLEFLLSPKTVFPTDTLQYDATASARVGAAEVSADADPLATKLEVPLGKEALYYGYQGTNLAGIWLAGSAQPDPSPAFCAVPVRPASAV
jgi:hypothetical protein